MGHHVALQPLPSCRRREICLSRVEHRGQHGLACGAHRARDPPLGRRQPLLPLGPRLPAEARRRPDRERGGHRLRHEGGARRRCWYRMALLVRELQSQGRLAWPGDVGSSGGALCQAVPEQEAIGWFFGCQRGEVGWLGVAADVSRRGHPAQRLGEPAPTSAARALPPGGVEAALARGERGSGALDLENRGPQVLHAQRVQGRGRWHPIRLRPHSGAWSGCCLRRCFICVGRGCRCCLLGVFLRWLRYRGGMAWPIPRSGHAAGALRAAAAAARPCARRWRRVRAGSRGRAVDCSIEV
mmetsp:Transcript_40633/g.130755  ORF Transcript_40633/g.130755 Transcript_40633/m.130755 type:complete len:298 (-) Transcript_40633:4627-5520(-)